MSDAKKTSKTTTAEKPVEKTTEKKRERTKAPPKGWPEGVWFSAADCNGDEKLFNASVHLASTDEAFRNYNGNKELEEQVLLRAEHLETITKLLKPAPAKKTIKESPKSKIVFAFLNGARTDEQRQQRHAAETGDNSAYEEAKSMIKVFRRLETALLALPDENDQEAELAFIQGVMKAAGGVARATFREKSGMLYISKKLTSSWKGREANAKKAAKKKAASSPSKKSSKKGGSSKNDADIIAALEGEEGEGEENDEEEENGESPASGEEEEEEEEEIPSPKKKARATKK